MRYFTAIMKKTLFYFLSAIYLFAEAPNPEKVELKFGFEPGKTYVYEQDMKVNMKMNNPMTQEKMAMETDLEQDFTFTAIEHEKGVKVNMAYDKFSMKTGSNGVTMMEFDSTAEANEENPMAKMFEPILNLTCFTIFDSEGKPLEFGGVDESPALEQMGIDAKQFEKTFTQGYEMLPKEAVSIGDTWKLSQDIPLGKMAGDVKVALVNTFEGIEELEGHKVARISYSGNVDVSLVNEENNDAPFAFKTKSYEGVYWHDMELNVIRKSTLNASIVISAPEGADVTANGMGEIPYDMEMEQTLKEVR